MPELSEGYKGLSPALAAPAPYRLLVWLGRHLQRSQGVRRGGLYHFFAAGLALDLPMRRVF